MGFVCDEMVGDEREMKWCKVGKIEMVKNRYAMFTEIPGRGFLGLQAMSSASIKMI